MAKKTKATIEMNYNSAIRQAKRVESVADNMKRLANQEFGGTMQSLSANWRGQEASMYLQKGSQLQEDIRRTANELQSAAQKIRSEAWRIRQADLKALEIIQS